MGRSMRCRCVSRSGMSSTRSVVTVSISVIPRAYSNVQVLSRFERTVRNMCCMLHILVIARHVALLYYDRGIRVATAQLAQASDNRGAHPEEHGMSTNSTRSRSLRSGRREPSANSAAALLRHLWGRCATLRMKTIIIVAATQISLLAMLYLPLRVYWLSSFSALEEQLLRTDANRALNAISSDVHLLDTLNTSFAIWDDTYAFVVDRSQNYI